MKKHFNKFLIAIGVCLMFVLGVTISIDRALTVNAASQTIENIFTPYNFIFTNNWLQYSADFSFSSNSNFCWTDGINLYYSVGSSHYILDVSTSTWDVKTWNGLTSFDGWYVWTDGSNTYYSNGGSQYILDVATSTWTVKTWNGLTSFNGLDVWTDGTNMYYSVGSSHYILDVATSTWTVKTWNGLTSFNGSYCWTDGTNMYYSYSSSQYILDIATSTWTVKTWNGLTPSVGNYCWTDGNNIYYSNEINNYLLDVSTSTWNIFQFTGFTSIRGDRVFVFNDIVFIPGSTSTWYMLEKDTSSGGSGGGNETNILYHFTGSSYNLLAFADSTNYIVGNHYIDIEDISSTQFDIVFNADILTAVNGNNALSYALGSSMSLSNRYNLNTSYTNTDYFYSQTFPYYINVTTTNWSNSDIVGCTISTILGVVTTQTNTGTWINDYGLVQYKFSYFNSSNERLNIMVAGTYDRTLIQTMPLVLSTRTYYFTAGSGSSGSFQEGYDEGFEDGQEIGFSDGYASGNQDAYNSGYNYGLEQGNAYGYERGKQAGILIGAANANHYTFLGLLSAVVDAPFTCFTSLTNFNLLGINIFNFLTGLFTLLLFLVIIKMLLGGK